MSGESENVLGEIRVVARLALGIEQLMLFVTEARILVAHVGKRGAGALATSALFGRLSGGFEDIVKSGGESRSKRALQRLTPERILTANKDNFPLRFGEIVGVRLVERPYSGEMTILTGDNKFEFQTQHPVDSIVGLLQIPLGPKLTVERLPEGVRKNRAH
ncbi:MAG: hypothetical protein AUF79_12345 [Crenarchaeota archaeon 13_1_20CM_2_51_8]|nr:MAG: hypothetical protein AUF62_03010 [archaeon 13_1_20CM_52_20]OLE89166.1 MAG: hypothetical protein AUF79_12345 [Crenarchaeota archaeon 13_1_20CM_2_51_8]